MSAVSWVCLPLLTFLLTAEHGAVVQDLQAVIDRELELHRQIYSAIWAAVAAMERWSSGVNKWLAKITKDTNSWMAMNAQIAEQQCGSAVSTGVGYVLIPAPAEVDLSQSLRPQPAGQELQLQQQQEFGATVIVKAGAATGEGSEAAAGIRLGADLTAAAAEGDGEPSVPSAPAGSSLMQGVTNEWVSTTGGGSVADGRWARNTKTSVSRVSIDLQKIQQSDLGTPARHRLGSTPGWGSINSPGGVSLHARLAGTPAGPSGLMATLRGFLGGGSGEPSSVSSPSSVASGAAGGDSLAGHGFLQDADGSAEAASGVGHTESPPAAGRPRSAGRAHLNRIAPFNAPAAAAGPPAALHVTTSRSSATVEDLVSPAAAVAAAGSGLSEFSSRTADAVPVGLVGAADGSGEGVADSDDTPMVGHIEMYPSVTGKVPHNRLQPMG